MPPIPPDVIAWFHMVFRECNERISEKLSNNPNLPEEQLDLTWIEHLSRFSSPIILASAWTVKIETHYLGGLRHVGRGEGADIGVLLYVRSGGRLERSKVALLQSKRLYPSNARVAEEGRTDYEIGFARLADPEDLARSIAVEAEFRFTEACRYGALIANSDQVRAITEYERENDLRVYYQFYNAWTVPLVQRVPLHRYGRPAGELALGVRILPSAAVHAVLAGGSHGSRPKLEAFADLVPGIPRFGWSLEHFVTEEFLACREGSVFDSIGEARIQNLFYRRTGPIAAAIAITIEAPAAAA